MQSEIFQAFTRYNFDDYGLQLMKTANSKSQKISVVLLKKLQETV